MVWVREEAVLVRDEAGEPLYWQGPSTTLPSARPWRSACTTRHSTTTSPTYPTASSSWTASGRP